MAPSQRARSTSQSSSGSGSSSGGSDSEALPPKKAPVAAKPGQRKSPASNAGSRSSMARPSLNPRASAKGKGRGSVVKRDSQQEFSSSQQELIQRAEEVMGELEHAFKATSLENAQAVREKLNMKARISSLKEELDKLRTSLDDTLGEQKFLEEELVLSLRESQELAERHSEAKRLILHVKGQLATSKEERIELQKHVELIRGGNQEVEQKRAILFKELFAHRQKLSAANVEQATVQTELSMLIKEKKTHLAHCETLARSIQMLQRKKEESLLDKDDAKAKVTELTKTKVHLETEIGQLDRDRSQLREKCGVITHDINSRQGKIGKISQEYRKIQAHVRKMEEQNRRLGQSLIQAEKLQKEVEQHANEAEAARVELQSRMSVAVRGGMNHLVPEDDEDARVPGLIISGLTETEQLAGIDEQKEAPMAGESKMLFSRKQQAAPSRGAGGSSKGTKRDDDTNSETTNDTRNKGGPKSKTKAKAKAKQRRDAAESSSSGSESSGSGSSG